VTEAVVLVGGRGTRLRPLTLSTPKPLLPVAGVPFLAHQLARLHDVGIDHVVLATSYRPEFFTEQFGDGSAYGIALDYVTEEVALGTAGGIRNVAELLCSGPDDPVVVLNGDIVSAHDIAAQLAEHRRVDAAVTLHLTVVEDARAFGCVPTDDSGAVLGFHEKMDDPVTHQVNAGCYVFRRSVIDGIPADKPVSVERETFPALLAAGARLQGYVDTGYWIDVGTPATYVRASCDLVRGVVASSALPGASGERLVLGGASVDGADIDGGTVVGPAARVAAGAAVHASIVGAGASIRAGAVVSRSVIGPGAVIGARTVVTDAVVADDAVVGADNELRNGVRIWPETVLEDCSVRFSTDA
jgi:mannose-1-phosphate guanylyltransferase